MRSSRVEEQMAKMIDSLAALRGDVRAVRLAIETGVAAHARHVARGKEEQEASSKRSICVFCGTPDCATVGGHGLCYKCAEGMKHL